MTGAGPDDGRRTPLTPQSMRRTDTRLGDAHISTLHAPRRRESPAPTFVLLHGIGMAGVTLLGLARQLSAHGEVWAPDLPGFGHSPELGEPRDIAQTADLMAEWMRAAGVSALVTLIGHSMGTQVATELAVRHPALVDRLILMAPTVDRGARTVTQQVARMAEDLRDDSQRVLRLGALSYLRVGPRWFAGKLRVMMRHHLEDVLPLVARPTLVLRSADDRVCPRPWVGECADLAPHSVFVELPGLGHETMISNPRPAAEAILRFVS